MLVTHNNHTVIQLLLSSEIDPFEDKQLENPGSQGFRTGGAMLRTDSKSQIRRVFLGYLEAQGAVAVYILQFRSTIELQSMVQIGPLVMKIMILHFWMADPRARQI